MLRLLNFLSTEKNINAHLKSVAIVAFFFVFGLNAFGQNCNGLNVTLGPDVEYCNDATVTISSSFTGGPSAGSPSYTWSLAPFQNGNTLQSSPIQGANSSSYSIPSFSSTNDGLYICTISFPNGCSDIDTIEVDQPNGNNNFNLTSGNDFTICPQVTANINSSIANIPAGGTVSYSWISDPAGYTSNLADPSFSNLTVGTYDFIGTATANGCSDNTQIQVTVANFTISAGADITICPGQSVSLNSTITNGLTTQEQSNVTYSWSSSNGGYTSTQADPTFSNLPAGNYNFTVNATYNSCIFTDIVNVNVISPQITNPAGLIYCLQPNQTSGIVGFYINLPSNVGSLVSNYTVNWNDNSPIQTFTASSTPNWSSLISHTFPAGNHPIQLTMNLISGCSSSVTLNAFVGSSPSPAALQLFAGQAESCVGETTSFYFNVPTTNVNGTTYSVNWNDGSPVEIYTHPNTPSVLTHVFQI